eukprot:TRINITY_DN1071_c1_g1_i1.p1 TRINITY_DN1071_c1_g1~~TRINITY_DN1071_c1_g1_i1.p1  ORF type:complete len:427 (-),score=101.09 TRINITY_DN1071_c1_g1_i1:331-1476(-)
MDTFRDEYVAKCAEYSVSPRMGVLSSLESALESGINLQMLDMRGNTVESFASRLDDKQLFALVEALEVADCFERVDMSFNNISDAGAAVLARFLKNSKRMEHLNLESNSIGCEGAKYLASATRGNGNIRSIVLSHNPIGNEAGVEWADVVRDHESLIGLHLANCDLHVSAVIAFAISLAHEKCVLESLDLSRPLIRSKDDEWAMHMADALRVNKRLRQLTLRKCDFTDESIRIISESICENSALEKLDVSQNRIGVDGGKSLARLIRLSDSLKELHASNNRIGNVGAAAIARVIPLNGTLLVLNLRSNNIEEGGLCLLLDAISTNTGIRFLLLWGNYFGPSSGQLAISMLEARGRDFVCDLRPYIVDGEAQVAEENLRRPL